MKPQVSESRATDQKRPQPDSFNAAQHLISSLNKTKHTTSLFLVKGIVHSWGGAAGGQRYWVLVNSRFSCVITCVNLISRATKCASWSTNRKHWGLHLSNVENTTCCPFSTFALMNMQCWVFLPECAKCKEDLAQALWFTTLNSNTNLKLIAELFVFASLLSTSERQVLISTASHTGGCCCCGADCNNAPIRVISCVLHLSFYV